MTNHQIILERIATISRLTRELESLDQDAPHFIHIADSLAKAISNSACVITYRATQIVAEGKA